MENAEKLESITVTSLPRTLSKRVHVSAPANKFPRDGRPEEASGMEEEDIVAQVMCVLVCPIPKHIHPRHISCTCNIHTRTIYTW